MIKETTIYELDKPSLIFEARQLVYMVVFKKQS